MRSEPQDQVGQPSDDILSGIPEQELQELVDWRQKVEGANISQTTLLATDYLNHFNEIVMLIEMIPDMPMMLDECYQWQPKSYQEHFRDSGFSDRDLAIAAYDHVPGKFRKPLEQTVEHLQLVVSYTVQKMAALIADGDEERLRQEGQSACEILHRMIQIANGIIHGYAHVMEQNEIDSFLGVE